MSTDLFKQQSRLVVQGVCHEIGCTPADIVEGRLTIVEGPAASRPEVVAFVATDGIGTVASVPGPLLDWVRNHAPERGHSRALQPFFLADLAAEIRRRGIARHPRAHGVALGFALAMVPELPAPPAGYELRQVDMEWVAGYRLTATFPNALGNPAAPASSQARAGAFAVFDPAGSPAAAAGWRDDGHGLLEIGVDVSPGCRGLGLGRLAVAAATRQILESGGTPFYSCGADNIPSQRTALSCGYLPIGLLGVIIDEAVLAQDD